MLFITKIHSLASKLTCMYPLSPRTKAPPHGVFPYGNILAMLLWPSLTGHHFLGLAANNAIRVPVFKQILRSIGVVDASRTTARKSLESYPYTIGISTGKHTFLKLQHW